jgi:glycosyltransferase involved in cell wall biosynthesis
VVEKGSVRGLTRDAVISLVIPAHNEAQNIATVLRASRTVLAGINESYEIIVVDDASSDDTGAIARHALGPDAARVRVLVHERQMGYAVTVCDGLRAARGEILGFMDGDRQFDPRELTRLVEMLAHADMVAGYRSHRADPWHRSLVSGVYNLVVRLAFGLRLRDFDCGLKVLRREVFEAAQPLVARSAAFNPEIAFKARRAGFRIVQTPVSHYSRRAGRRSGARLKPILRAVRDIVRLRIALRQESVSLTGRRVSPTDAPAPTHQRRTHDTSS